jgi:sigma-B regulation protein RsbU (phosphoserine phosphatase)
MSARQSSTKLEQIERLRALEIEEAQSIQRAMVCVEPLRADPVEIASRFRPVIEVGGDFLDYFRLQDHRLGLYLGDVVGKGLAAAMYAALAMGTIRGIHKSGTSPTSVMALMNERLRMRVVPGRYCALQYAVYDPATRELSYANAGLPRPILVSSKGCREVGEGGLPSGLFAGAEYDRYSLVLQPGEAVLFCTDGIPDSRNESGDDFGLERVLEVCEKQARASADALLDRLFAEVDAFAGDGPAHDDMTAIVLKIS